jgi:hypothetical protein
VRRTLSCPNASCRDRRDRVDDCAIPAEHRRRLVGSESQRSGHDRGRQRSRELTPQLGAPGRFQRVDQRLGLDCGRPLEPIAHLAGAKRTDERRAMISMRLAVEAEHARPDDLRRREARIVDRERRRVAHRLEHEVMPGYEPAVERVDP